MPTGSTPPPQVPPATAAHAGLMTRAHVATLAGHGTRLDGHDSALAGHGTRLDGHDSTLAGHGTRLDGHDSALAGHGTRLDGHDSTLAAHGGRLTTLEGVPPNVRVYRTTNLSIPSSTFQPVSFDATLWANSGALAPDASGVFSVPKRGWYHFWATVQWQSSTAGFQRTLQWRRVSGTPKGFAFQRMGPSPVAGLTAPQIVLLAHSETTDTWQLRAFQDTGGALSLLADDVVGITAGYAYLGQGT